MPEPMMRSLLRGEGMTMWAKRRTGVCRWCGQEFETTHTMQKFCLSRICQDAARAARALRAVTRARKRKEQRNER